MKRSTTSSRKARTGDRQLFARSSNQVRRRAGTFKLEPLEERTLLSVSPRGTAASPQAVLNVTNAAVPSQSPGTSVDTTVTQQTGASSLPSALAQSIKDAKTVATVTASPTTPTAAALALSSHIYTGQPQTFNGVNAGTSSSATGSVSTSSSGRSSLSNSSLAALTALSKTLKAEPQYLVLPSKAQGGGPDAGEGPGGGYTPQQIQGAYGSNLITFGSIQGDGAGQTIAVIDLGDDPDFVSTSDPNFDASALHVFDQQFGLPDPPSFQKYNEDGNTSPLPAPVPGVSLEIALDIEWSHAIAPAANIILVEGNTSQPTDMFTAARTAGTTLGASVVSQSFGYSLEVNGMGRLEPMFDKTYYAPALAANPGLTFLAATGDAGSSDAPIYPSASPLVVGVGGTSLFTNGSTWIDETGWSGSGGGPSTIYSAPSYQQESVTGYTARTVPDVAADADPHTGVSVYSPSDGGWFTVGGTSAATPIWAGLIGIADQGRALFGGKALDGPNQTLPGLYSAIDYTNNYHDITVGNNGYPAGPGYDLVTGIGSPRANGIIPYLSTYDLQPEVISSTPAAGSVVTPTPPTTFSLTFGEPIVPSSIVASDFTVNGIGANSFTLSSNDLTITYTFNTSPVTTQGSQTMNLPAQSVSGAAGPNLYPFSANFYYVQTQLQVTGTSPAVGSVLTVPDTDQTDLVVQFNKAFNPTTINTSDFQVSQGSVVSAVPLTSQSVDLTLSGITQDGSLTLTVPFGVILDTLGVPNAVFTGNYIVDIVSEPYPTPLQGQDPAGSLIYDPSVSGTIGFAGNTDTFTLPLAAGQTLSLVMTTAPGLIGTVTLLDPNDNVIGTATGSGPGATVVLETVPIKTAGTYSLVASGSGTTPGNYTLQAILNAAYKPATDNISTIGTAYDLTSAFTSLGTTPAADRAGVIGVLSSSPDYYAVPLTAGEATSIAIKGRGGEASIALYDSSGNLMALPTAGTGVDGIISDFIAPSKGTYYVQVTGDPGLQFNLVVTRGADFTTQPHTTLATAQDITATEQSGVPDTGGALGYLSSTKGTDFYSVNANVGDNLHFATTTPAGGPNEFVNNLHPELLLYDPNGNLVAIANGNAADGRNSVIDFTVPDGDAGKWTIEVTASPDTPTLTAGEYGLLVTGATGTLSPFEVSSTVPATNALLQPPTTITVTFNDPVLIASLTPGELEVNGVPATAVSDVSANTVSWTVDPTSYPTGVDLPNRVTIGADSTGDQVTDVSGQTLTPYSYTFYTTNVPPTVVSSSVNNQVFSPAPANVTETVTFSQPMDTSFTTASSFDLLGKYRNVQYAAASFSWDHTGKVLTINFTNLPDDTYTLTLLSSKFESSVRIPLASNYLANFAVALGTKPFATPLTPVPPLGDLIYTGTNTHVLVTSTDVDDLTLPLNAGGTLTLIGTPTTSALQLTITVLDPSNNVVATATAPAAGQNSVIETAPVATTGTYTIKVGDAGGNVGLYSIQAYLNSYVKQGNSNGTIGTAQDLTSSSYVLGSGNAVRLGVVDPNTPSQDTQDYYSFDLTQGQTATIVAESLNNKGLQITLVDGSGKVLATGVGGSTNVSQSIQNYVASSTGKYFIEITGDPGDQYSLVVTRGAAFSVQDHHTYSTAQNLTGTNGVLGYLAPPTPLLYTLDDQLSGSANPIWATDPTTGAFIPPSINAPGSPLNNPYGLNLAYDGTDLYYNNGSDHGDNTIYKLNPTTGAVLASGIPSGAPLFTGLAYLDGKLYGIAGFHPTIYVIDPNTFQVISTFSTNIANTNVVGLAGDPDRDVLWAVTQPYTTNGDIDEINPNTGNVIASAPDNHLGSVQDIAYADGQLIVSDSVSFGPGHSYLDYYDPNTLNFIQRLPVATQGSVSGLGGDGLGGPAKDDWYTINVQAGQALYLQSSTPSDQGGQFPNTASLEIELYDTFGNLVAVGTKVADGRNEALFYNAPVTGQYHIRVHEDPGGEGEYYLSVNTAQYQSGDISGQVYNDLNGSGSFVPGDPGLDNWEVDVYDSSDNFVASQLTSGGGNFNIAGLAPGTYTISEVQQSGWTQTQPVAPYTYTVTVTAGQTSGGYDFGNFQNISISGETFNDLNGNGNHDPGEPGLTGWTVDLYDANNNLVATTVTDVNGDYSFTNIGPGTYTVQEKLQTGWIQTAPASPGTYAITATSGQDSTGLLFGNYQLVTYSGTVYNDLNGSGVIAPGDPGLPGWTVELLDSQGNILATTTSAFDGSYAFANLTYGVYTIEEVTPSGWYQTEPQNPFVYTVTATSGASHSGLNFGNFQAVNVTGEVYNDLNGNGNLDPGEPGLLGWTVLLLDPAGNTVASTTSDANGDYEFDNLFPGTFTVEEILQSGWVQTQPVNPNYYSITTSSGTNIAGETFGNFKAVSVSGNVYNDLNGNGLHDSGEPGLQGWTVQLENSSGTVIASVLSDVNGNYTFTGVGGGTYEVAAVVQTNWVQTQPLYPTVYSFTSRSGTNLLALNFGDHASPALTPAAVIDNGQPGYSETGSWSTVMGGFNGTNRVAKTVQAGGPPSTATWNFSSISPATYDVYVTFAGKSGYSEAVPYTVYNGSTELGTVDVNQSILVTQSQGLTQGSYGGVGWLELGAFTISSTDIQVVLSNLATGNFVDADGVLLVPQGGGQGRGVSGPATVGPNSAVGANSTNSSVSIGTLNFNSTAPSTNGNGQQSQVISLSGVSQPAALSVSYNQGSQPVVNQSSLSLIDAVLGLGTSASNSTSNSNGNSWDDAITALAQSLISSNKNS
ncbi:MAG: SdrD B-like domain-containing protein [Isosphaeraceae bacterium]